MKIVELECPKCGAPMTSDYIRRSAHCDYCGNNVLLEHSSAHLIPEHEYEASQSEDEQAANRALTAALTSLMQFPHKIGRIFKRMLIATAVLAAIVLVVYFAVRYFAGS